MIVQTLNTVVDNILKVFVSVPDGAMAKSLSIKGQSAVSEHHITLIRLDDDGVVVEARDLPLPPQNIELDGITRYVDTGVKQCCYMALSQGSAQRLRQYANDCAAALGLDPSVVDDNRVFHVTLSNAGDGHARSSVGSPWEFSSRAL